MLDGIGFGITLTIVVQEVLLITVIIRISVPIFVANFVILPRVFSIAIVGTLVRKLVKILVDLNILVLDEPATLEPLDAELLVEVVRDAMPEGNSRSPERIRNFTVKATVTGIGIVKVTIISVRVDDLEIDGLNFPAKIDDNC